ncbi:F-box family protein, partial [Trifolium pratense]
SLLGQALPKDMILQILSTLETKEAIQRTCRVSRRWKTIWQLIPSLNLRSDSFQTVADFDKFVTSVLLKRGSCPMTVLSYHRHGKEYKTNQDLFEKLIKYAVSNGVEDIEVKLRTTYRMSCKVKVPTDLFGSKSLKRLEFSYWHDHSTLLDELGLLQFMPRSSSDTYRFHFLSNPLGVDFRLLTTLNLNNLSLKYRKNDPVSPFSKMAHLKNLELSQIWIESYPGYPIPKKIVISCPQLTKVKLICNNFHCKVAVKIVAPMLRDIMHLHLSWWSTFRFHFPLIEEGLVIHIKEHKELPPTTSHTLNQLKRTRANVKVFQQQFEVLCKDAPFMNLEKFINRDDVFMHCGAQFEN